MNKESYFDGGLLSFIGHLIVAFFHHRLNSRNCHTLGRLFYARLESQTYCHRWSTFIF